MHKILLFKIALFQFLFLSHGKIYGQFDRTSDSLALIALFDSCDGSNWVDHTNWKSNLELKHWFGITTDAKGRVTIIQLIQNNLTGRIPKAINTLSELEELHLSQNSITGTIHEQFEHLKELKLLDLSINRIEGKLNRGLLNLISIEELTLSVNQLTGNLPDWFDSLPNLAKISLYNNRLDGTLPPSIFNSPKLQSLILTDNQLTGTIPNTIQKSRSLVQVYLSNNNLSGSLPDIARLTKLQSFYIQENRLSGAIPTSYSSHPNLKYLNIGNNFFLFEDMLNPKPIAQYFFYQPQRSFYDTSILQYVIFRDSVSLKVSANHPNNQYQWFRNSNPLPGETSNILKIDSFQLTDTGTYYAVVTNSLLTQLTIPRKEVRLIGMYPLSNEWISSTVKLRADHIEISWRASFEGCADSLVISAIQDSLQYTIQKKQPLCEKSGQCKYYLDKGFFRYFNMSVWKSGRCIAESINFVEKNNHVLSLRMFPIPVRNNCLNISLTPVQKHLNLEMLIYAVSGQLVFQKTYEELDATFQVELEDMAKGRYFMVIKNKFMASAMKSFIIE